MATYQIIDSIYSMFTSTPKVIVEKIDRKSLFNPGMSTATIKKSTNIDKHRQAKKIIDKEKKNSLSMLFYFFFFGPK